MPFHVYIIYSASIDRYCIGQTQDVDDRLFRHNNSGSKSTKKARDWKLVYLESFADRSSAVQREMEIKSKKKMSFIESLIKKNG